MIGHAMHQRHYRKMIVDAVQQNDIARIDQIVGQIMDCVEAKAALRLKGYGDVCMTATAAVRLVPVAPRDEPHRR